MARDNKRIFKNSIYLYGRLLITMAVSLLTARIILRELGVEDYGTYNIVAGLISIFASLKSMFAGAIQRFYNYEIGQSNDSLKINEIFNLGIIVHVLMAVVLLIVIEPFGIYMINNQLDIPDRNFGIAHVIFQLNMFMMILSLMAIPFDAMVMAKEKMGFYAGLSLIDAGLRLLQAFTLIWVPSHKLIVYACCITCISIINFLIEVIYARRTFKECYYRRCWNKELFKKIATFSGWNFFGNVGYSVINEGFNILLNLFSGVVANAARGIAVQVKGAIMNVLANALVAVRPQATQEYAQGHYQSFFDLVFFASKTLFMVSACMVLPLIFFIEPILQLWLGQVPEFSVIFIQILLIHILIRSFHEPIDLVFKSAGNLKVYQVSEFIVSCLSLLTAYILLKLGSPIYIVFVVQCVMEALDLVMILFIARHEGLSLRMYCSMVGSRVILVGGLAVVLCYIVYKYFSSMWFVGLCLMVMAVALSSFFVGYGSIERKKLISLVKHK